MPETLVLYPGAVAAGGTLSIPPPYPEAEQLLAFLVKRKNSITWSGLGTASATIATDDVAAASSGSDQIAETVPKTIVTGTPAAGEVALQDSRTIVVGDAIADGDLVVVVYIAKGEFLKA